jgi:preprotein translocase subunit SecF
MKIGTKLVEAASTLVDKIGDAFDKNFTNKEEKLQAKNELLAEANKLVTKVLDAQKEILLSETTGNKLQRSWRPLVMLAFAFIVVYSFFIQPAFFPNAVNISETLPADFWGLLKIGLGGYVIGRSAEKVSHKVADTLKK